MCKLWSIFCYCLLKVIRFHILMIFILVFEDFEMKRSILTYHALLLSGKHCTIGKPLTGFWFQFAHKRDDSSNMIEWPISDLDNSIRRPIIESIRAYPVPRLNTVREDPSQKHQWKRTWFTSSWKYFPKEENRLD